MFRKSEVTSKRETNLYQCENTRRKLQHKLRRKNREQINKRYII